MAGKIIVTGRHETYVASLPDKTWVFDEKARISSPDDNAVTIDFGATSAIVVVEGKLEGAFNRSGLFGLSDNMSITIAEGGEALGQCGVLAVGTNSDLRNFGTSNTLQINGDDSVIRNSGLVTSFTAGLVAHELRDSTLINEKSGVIDVSFATDPLASAMSMQTLSGQTGTMINNGLLKSGYVMGGEGNDIFINNGKLTTSARMGDGDDLIDNRHGVIKQYLVGDGGNDTYQISHATDNVYELDGGGIDTVEIATGYQLGDFVERLVLTGSQNLTGTGSDSDTANSLHGNSGKNLLAGLGGVDALSGGAGADTLTGGAGADYFYLTRGSGRDVVTDFSAEDFVVVTGFTSAVLRQTDNSLEFRIGRGDVLVLQGASIAQLHDGSVLTNFSESDFFDMYG
jgi:Ca2+-binding RTX toxin-like protein